MKRVLMIAPQFPPDGNAGTHRVRLLAPRLADNGWLPTVLTVDPRDYEPPLDDSLADLVPPGLDVVRVRALPARTTRRFGIGDLGLRALPSLGRAASALLAARRYDAVFITVFPAYPALLGPWLARRHGVPYVIDYQDPWVSAWGRTVGGGSDGRVDLKSRVSRAVALQLEPRALRTVSAITAVSTGTWDDILARNPSLSAVPRLELPIGYDVADFDALHRSPHDRTRFFDPDDGLFHLCGIGTHPPLGMETLRALLAGAALLSTRAPRLYARLRIHFLGTTGRFSREVAPIVLPAARAAGVADIVSEVPWRLPYLDALDVQTRASALLLLGSSEPHYTASRLFPSLLAARPLLAAYHRGSTVVSILERASAGAACPPPLHLVTYDDHARAEREAPAIARALASLVERFDAPARPDAAWDLSAIADYSAASLAARLAALLDEIAP